MLEYMYTRRMPPTPASELTTLLDAATKYELPDLQEQAASALVEHISPLTIKATAAALKQYKDDPQVAPAWALCLRKVQTDLTLLEAVLVPEEVGREEPVDEEEEEDDWGSAGDWGERAEKAAEDP